MRMKTFKPDFKKITGLLGALLFAGSLMIGQLPADAVAEDIIDDSCLGPCQYTTKSCGGGSGFCYRK